MINKYSGIFLVVSSLIAVFLFNACGSKKCEMTGEQFIAKGISIGVARATKDAAKEKEICKEIKEKMPNGCEISLGNKVEKVDHNSADFKKICP